jgi:hypothetical protein
VFATTAEQPKSIVRSIPEHKWPVKGFKEDQSQAETNVSEGRDTTMTSPPDVVP